MRFTPCSGCEDSIEQDDPDEPWILEEGELCAFETPDEEFVQIDENNWSRVLPIVRQGCGDYQATITVAQRSEEQWSVEINSRICNRCDETRFVFGEGDGGGEASAGAMSFVGVLDEQKRRYMFGCGYPLHSLIMGCCVPHQLDIDPGMMYEFTYQVRGEGVHPERLPERNPDSPPYYDNPLDFSSELALLVEWPHLRAPTDHDCSVSVDFVEAICAEFLDEGTEYESARRDRETYYFEHVIEEPHFPEEFEAFLHSRDFAD